MQDFKTFFINSLDVVFPLVPVIPIKGIVSFSLCVFAKSCNVFKTFSTNIVLGLRLYFLSSIIANEQPFLIASNANLLPLKCSPLRAKNIPPDFMFLESVQM